MLLGEIDPTRPNPLKEVSAEEILQLQHERNDLRQQQERLRNKLLMDRGTLRHITYVRVCPSQNDLRSDFLSGLQPETLFDDIY